MEYSNSQLREAVSEFIHNERDRRLFLKRYEDGFTLEKLAEDFELSVSQVKRIIKKHYYPVFRHIGQK